MKKSENNNGNASMDIEAGGGRRRLKTLPDVRRLIAHTINELDANKISENRARAVGYLTSILASVIERSDLEARLTALEEKLERKGK